MMWPGAPSTGRYCGTRRKAGPIPSGPPLGPKLPAYKAGIDRVAAEDMLRRLSVRSMHTLPFSKRDSNPEAIRFREEELAQAGAAESGDEAGGTPDGLERDLHLLRFCDNLSLFICLNEPGRNTFPLVPGGSRLSRAADAPALGRNPAVAPSPTPFRQPFTVAIPYQIFNEAREPEEEDS